MKKILTTILTLMLTLNSALAVGFLESDWDSYSKNDYHFENGNVVIDSPSGNALNYVGAPLKMSDGAKLTFAMSFDNDSMLAIESDYMNVFSINPLLADTELDYRLDFMFNSNGFLNLASMGDGNLNEKISGFIAGETSQVIVEYIVQGTDLYANVSINGKMFQDILIKSGISNEGIFKSSFSLSGDPVHPIMTEFSYSEVPEPATYAFIFGALAFGVIAWRRSK